MQSVRNRSADGDGLGATEVACNRLRMDILTLTLRPGEPLIEEQIARRLGLSRTPVREAFGLLEAEGLVRRIRNRGAVVTEVSLETALEAFEIREHLEAVAARKACASITHRQLVVIRGAISKINPVPVSVEELIERERLDEVVHTTILDSAGNQLLKETVEATRRRMSRVLFTVPAGRSRIVVEEHHLILSALERRDAEQADAAMRQHIRNSAARLVGMGGENFSILAEFNGNDAPASEHD